MANRYWVGGTGTWDATNTANWSTSSGGAGGASVPGASDAAIFDGNSGGGTVTPNFTFTTLQSFITTGFTGTVGSGALREIRTSVKLEVGNNISNIRGTVYGGTISMHPSSSFANIFTIQSSVSAVSLLSNLTSSQVTIQTSGYSFNSNGYSITAYNGSVSATANSGNVTLGASSITVSNNAVYLYATGGNVSHSGSITGASLVYVSQSGAFTLSTNIPSSIPQFFFNRSGTGTISVGRASVTITNSVYISGSCPCSLVMGSGATRAEFGSGASVPSITTSSSGDVRISSSSAGAITGTFTANMSSTPSSIQLETNVYISTLNVNGPVATTTIRSYNSGVRRQLGVTSYSLANITWKDIEAAGTIPFTGTNFIDDGNNLNITFPVAATGNSLFFGSNF